MIARASATDEPISCRRLQASCAYCGLPVATEASEEAKYCCFGCRFAASIAEADGETGQSRWLTMRLGIAIFCSMNVMVFTFFLWSQESATTGDAAAVIYDVARYVCLIFTAPVLLLLGGPLSEDATNELIRGRPSLNLLLVVGSAAAFVYSLVSVVTNQGHVYFEVPCVVLVAVTLGRWLEATGKLRTTDALRGLEKLLPEKVRLVSNLASSAGREELIPLAVAQAGDCLRILPGERIPIDGRILRGRAALDEQLLTGESVPREKGPGDLVHSGTLNLDGELVLESIAPANCSAVQQMIDAVSAALASKGRFQRLAELVSAWFLPLVVGVALISFVIHLQTQGLGPALLAGLAVVVIACPCALGLATPMALWAAVGCAIRSQVLIRDGDAMAQLSTARTIAFDKTGTLTTSCDVARFESANAHAAQVAVALAEANSHPFSQAIDRWGIKNGIVPLALKGVRIFSGRGVRGHSEYLATDVLLGAPAWVSDLDTLNTLSDDESIVAVGWEGRIQGHFNFREQLRPGAAAALQNLQKQGLDCVVLSGDGVARVTRVASELGVACQAALLPADKIACVHALQASGPVVMVGDGLNDAPALAAADVGIALGCGADVSRWTASVCLLTDDLSRLPWLIDLSRRTVRTIRWNLVWAFGYNVLGIPLAASGYLHPAMAAAAMAISSVLVVANSLQLASNEATDELA